MFARSPGVMHGATPHELGMCANRRADSLVIATNNNFAMELELKSMKSARRWGVHGAVLALTATLAACGGGGSGGGLGAVSVGTGGTGTTSGTSSGTSSGMSSGTN